MTKQALPVGAGRIGENTGALDLVATPQSVVSDSATDGECEEAAG
jgi:hypothetical protein